MNNSPKDYYSILGVLPSAASSQISKAYKNLVKRYHPDKHADNDLEDLAREKMQEITEAYEVLKDTNKRKAYDLNRQYPHQSVPGQPAQVYYSRKSVKFIRFRNIIFYTALFYLLIRYVRSPLAIGIVVTIIILVRLLPAFFKTKKK